MAECFTSNQIRGIVSQIRASINRSEDGAYVDHLDLATAKKAIEAIKQGERFRSDLSRLKELSEGF